MSARVRLLGLVTLTSLSALACATPKTEEPAAESHDPAAEAARLKPYVLDEAPADVGTHVDADLEGKVTLLGARVEGPSEVKPGAQVKYTLYWKVNQKLEGGYKLFTHVVDGAGERLLNIDNVGPLRELRGKSQALPPSDWEVGKVYADEQTFTVPAKVKTDKIQVMTGIFKKGGRLKVVSGPKDSTNRVIAATLSVSGAKNTRIPTLHVDKLDSKTTIKIDGKLDEAAWKDAANTGPFLDVGTGEANKTSPVNGEAKVLWNDSGLYVGISVTEKDIVGGFKKGEQDPHLWTKDTVEIMVDPDGNGDNKNYYEIQVSPQNLVFDSQFDAYNEPKTEPDGPFGHQEWSANLKSAVTIDGTIDKSSDEDRGYTVEVMIPWKSFGKAETVPPELGSAWRVNFYAMKNNGGVAWSPILGQGNFHKASRFGRIVWGTKPTAEAATGSGGGSGSGGSSGSSSGSAGASGKSAVGSGGSTGTPVARPHALVPAPAPR